MGRLKQFISYILAFVIFFQFMNVFGNCTEIQTDGAEKETILSETNMSDLVSLNNQIVTISTYCSVMFVEGTYQFACTVGPEALSNDVTWSSSDPSVLQVSSDGFVTALSEGLAIVTVSLDVPIAGFTNYDTKIVNVKPSKNNNIYYLLNCYSNKYLTLRRALNYQGDNVYQRSLNNVMSGAQYAGQDFRFVYDSGNKAYRIYPMASGNGDNRCLDRLVASGSTNNNIRIRGDGNGNDPTLDQYQLFRAIYVGSGKYKIALKADPSLVLTVYDNGEGLNTNGNTVTSQGNVFLSTYVSGNTKQQWMLSLSGKKAEETYYTGLNIGYPFHDENHYKINSTFGWRVISGSENLHRGTDFNSASNVPLYSVCSGTVIKKVDDDPSCGNYIIIEASNLYSYDDSTKKLRFVYMHMIGSSPLNVNDTITVNTIVGYVGSTGDSSGPHLHLSVIKNGSTTTAYSNCVDPQMFYRNLIFTY